MARGSQNYDVHLLTVWDLYFASIVTMAYHPGAGTRGHKQPTIEDCGDIADQMLEEREKRCLQ